MSIHRFGKCNLKYTEETPLILFDDCLGEALINAFRASASSHAARQLRDAERWDYTIKMVNGEIDV